MLACLNQGFNSLYVNTRLSRWLARTLRLVVVCVAGLLTACVSTSTPSNANNICSMFDEKRSWYRSAKRSEKKWGIPIPILMAVIYRESSFRAMVRPPRKKVLGFIPGRRLSTSLGYSQAKDETWSDYIKATKNHNASRTNFADSIDFVGWYLGRSVKHLNIAPTNAEALYASYHVGLSGYRKGSWRNSTHIKSAAAKVQTQSTRYASQLKTCRLKKRWF